MKIVQLVGSGYVEQEGPQPKPGRGELLVRVFAAGLIPTERIWYPTTHLKSGAPREGAIPSHEFSGVVAAAGDNTGQFAGGQEVFGMNDWFAEGAMAEYCVAPATAVAPKPRNLTHEEAASVPISALTAWQGLIERARLQPGERVLVHGGAGAVGAYAIQIARLHGARVIATASASSTAFVERLGAQQVIDRSTRFESALAPVDIVFDTVGGDVLQRSWTIIKPRGRVVTIPASEENSSDPRVRDAFFVVEPNAWQLSLIAGLLESRQLRPCVDAVIPLSQAPDAYAGKVLRQHRGKVVVTVSNSTLRRMTA
jgi:NADPH:quinone reductase-like Zn-dependent oxidoreductase